MFSKLFLLCVLVVAAHAGHHKLSLFHEHGSGAVSSQTFTQHLEPGLHAHVHHAQGHDHQQVHDHAPTSYEYSYSVDDANSQDQKQHQESREGGTVRGQYSLVQPDGSTRTVTYTADDANGFQAQVSTSGGQHQLQDLHHTPGGYQHSVHH